MKKFENTLNSYNLNLEDYLIVSVSAGIDSMVLASLLLKHNKKIVIVHFNHNTRDNNIKEQELVVNFAKDNNILVHTFSLNIKNGNFQEEARKLRYKHLRKIAKKYQTKYIITAHHLDDLAETIILKTIRGSNLYGYAGIHDLYTKDGFVYLRPFINVSKQEIKEYATNNNILYLEDESNYTDNYARNRIRHAVIPILKQESPNYLEKMYEYHLTLKNTFKYIRSISTNLIVDGKINNELFLKQDLVIKNDMIALLLEKNEVDLSLNLINDLNNLINSSKPNLEYKLSNNMKFIKAYATSFIIKDIKEYTFTITLNQDSTTLPNMKKITFLSNGVNNQENHIKICYNNLELPLIARTRKTGDFVSFKFGTKKIKDLFIDLKVPKHLRDELVVITDSNNIILYVEGVYLNNTLGFDNSIVFKIENLKGDKNG